MSHKCNINDAVLHEILIKNLLTGIKTKNYIDCIWTNVTSSFLKIYSMY